MYVRTHVHAHVMILVLLSGYLIIKFSFPLYDRVARGREISSTLQQQLRLQQFGFAVKASADPIPGSNA